MFIKGLAIILGSYFIYLVTGLLIGFEEFKDIHKEDFKNGKN